MKERDMWAGGSGAAKAPIFSEWIDAKKHCPQVIGWYQVNHPQGTWTYSNCAEGYWDGKVWTRCFGWPSVKNAWGFGLDGKMVIPYFNPSAVKIIEPTEWRGFLV